MAHFMYGSIEISKVPKELFKKVIKADGTEGIFLNIGVSERKEVGKFGETHGVQIVRTKKVEKGKGFLVKVLPTENDTTDIAKYGAFVNNLLS